MKKLFILPICCFLVLVNYTVQAEPEGSLTLVRAISISLENNNRYKIAREKVNEKNFKINETWGELWPELNTGISTTYYGADKGTYTSSDGRIDLQVIKAGLSVNPGVFYNRLKASRDEFIISVNDERKIKSDTVVATIELFNRVLLAEYVVKLKTDSVNALAENLRIIEAGYKSGSFTKLDYLRAGVATANEKTGLINAENEYAKSVSAFNIQLGQDIDTPVKLDDIFMYDEKGSGKDYQKYSEKGSGLFNELVAVAVKNRPELLQIKSKKDFFTHRDAENAAQYLWPAFFLKGEYDAASLINRKGDINSGNQLADSIINGINDSYNPPGWNKSWSITAGATYRIGALSSADPSRSRSDEYKSMSKQTDMEIDEFLKEIKLEIQTGLLNLSASYHSIMTQKNNIKSAEESFRVAVLNFKNGIIDNRELLNANVELSNARTLYARSLYELQVSKAKLNRALGCDYFTF